jgi:hypothetical protein
LEPARLSTFTSMSDESVMEVFSFILPYYHSGNTHASEKMAGWEQSETLRN